MNLHMLISFDIQSRNGSFARSAFRQVFYKHHETRNDCGFLHIQKKTKATFLRLGAGLYSNYASH